MTTFEQERWPLHFALAWVLTRDRVVAERAKPTDFHPCLDTNRQDSVGRAWRMLYASLANGRIPAFGASPEDFASLDWADLAAGEGIVVSSSEMIAVFPIEGDPVEFTSDQIGQPIPPDGPGYITLSEAAYWIATEAGTKRVAARDTAVWQGVFDKLLPRMQSGDVRVVGRKRGAATAEVIAPASFVGLRVDYPYVPTPRDMFFGPGPYIKCCGPLIPDSLADQISDELFGTNRDAAG